MRGRGGCGLPRGWRHWGSRAFRSHAPARPAQPGHVQELMEGRRSAHSRPAAVLLAGPLSKTSSHVHTRDEVLDRETHGGLAAARKRVPCVHAGRAFWQRMQPPAARCPLLRLADFGARGPIAFLRGGAAESAGATARPILRPSIARRARRPTGCCPPKKASHPSWDRGRGHRPRWQRFSPPAEHC